ncbi:hypothetical protein C8J57DRAFT_1280764 [Mycena rebaudengoi]|nr:hypothetical protein C8J57DRAFT_1280764 [Mycena rebaudengoi]
MPAFWRSRLFVLVLLPSIFGLFYVAYLRGLPIRSLSNVTLEDSAVGLKDRPPSPILLVSAFFPLSKSKHSMRDYEWWLCQFLRPITVDIFFYTSVEMEPLVRKCRGRLPITIDTTFSTPFDIPPLKELKEPYDKMHALDRERKIHSAELYAVWNAKPYFLDEAVKTLSRQGTDYKYAFWNDAGSFRSSHEYTDWPATARVNQIWEEGSALTGEAKENLLNTWVPVDNEFSEGSFFGGSPKTITWWRETFYTYHDYYLGLGMFVGKDQTLINALFLLFPSRIITGALGTCGEEWFYYQFWLATSSARELMQNIWESRARWRWGGWRQRHKCALTRVLSVKDLLQRQFGPNWQPPIATINSQRL